MLLEATGCEELVAPCPIVNVGESYTDNWAPEVAQTNMEQFLTQNNNEVDAVVASNDGMAGGVVAAMVDAEPPFVYDGDLFTPGAVPPGTA